MRFIDKILHEPSYGWCDDDGELITPPVSILFREALDRINIFKTRKNWISVINWLITLCMLPFICFFIFHFFSFKLLIIAIFYGMSVMAIHATIWYHRYCTHKAYTFSNPVWKFIIQNMVIRTFPEEIYVISHHVHHAKSDKPGDPYNSKGGLMYCMLADVNHQCISKNLRETEYYRQ